MTNLFEGLPPCVRGNLGLLILVVLYLGSTPVCTGKSGGGGWWGADPEVYPRVYGEIKFLLVGNSLIKGLPPCVRGNH